MTMNGDKCPKCNQDQFPKYREDSKAIGRKCLNCGFEEEREIKVTKIVTDRI